MNKKSILEQALLQVENLEDAVRQNAKGILGATMKRELNDLLKEAEEEDDDFAPSEEGTDDVTGDESEDDVDTSMNNEDSETSDEESFGDEDNNEESFGNETEGGETESGEFGDGDDDEDDWSGDEEGEGDEDVLDMTNASDGEVLKVFKAMSPEDNIIVKKDGNKLELNIDGEDYIIKLDEQEEEQTEIDENNDESIYEIELDEDDEEDDDTAWKPKEVKEDAKPYGAKQGPEAWDKTYHDGAAKKTMSGGNTNSILTTKRTTATSKSGEFKEQFTTRDPKAIKPSENWDEPKDHGTAKKEIAGGTKNSILTTKRTTSTEVKEDSKPFGAKKETTGDYPKGMKNGNPNKGQMAHKGTMDTTKKPKTVEVGEAARTLGNQNREGSLDGMKFKAGRPDVHSLNEEVESLRKQNTEYKKALVLFKEKLNEVAVFNANLAYATRLFTEHTTTKQEKLDILKRFDTVSTINEGKNLYGQINTELGTKKPVTETVVNKISSTPKTSSTEILSESKAYENPQFKRMKELMGKLNK